MGLAGPTLLAGKNIALFLFEKCSGFQHAKVIGNIQSLYARSSHFADNANVAMLHLLEAPDVHFDCTRSGDGLDALGRHWRSMCAYLARIDYEKYSLSIRCGALVRFWS